MQVGSYELLQALAEGGMGRVWLAKHVHLGTLAVVKSLHPQYVQNEHLHQRFLTEARLLAQLSHPAIVRLYDYTVQQGVPYLIMEYVQGQSLESYLKQHSALSVEESIPILQPIFDALGYLHRHKIIHRDIKPSNVLVLPSGEGKLIDFGIAKALDEDLKLTQVGMRVGTTLYMAPEQIRGEPVSPQTDLYAMGLVIAECLFGCPPWEWEGLTLFQLYQRLLNEPPKIPDWAPPEWRTFLNRALAKAPEDRFPSAEVMKEAFLSLRKGGSHSVGQPSAESSQITYDKPKSTLSASRPQERGSLGRAWTVLGIVVAVGIVGASVYFLFESLATGGFSQSERSVRLFRRNFSTVDYGPKVRQALKVYLAQRYAPPDGWSVEWGSFPEVPLYEPNGTILVPVTLRCDTVGENTLETMRACYLSGIPLGPPRGRQKVTKHYKVYYRCVKSGFAEVVYRSEVDEEGYSFAVSLPSLSGGDCVETQREFLFESEGPCE
ncbi:MAG: serine/threonine protein kinase [Bacteroidia bacterium]|nr:serine/threonine protein kinase [Bacteroidia bacterium]